MTHRERVLAALRVSSRPLDDDQLSRRAEVRPRQAVNQVCRLLEQEGLLRRYVGVDGKIVNDLLVEVVEVPLVVAAVERPSPDARPPGSSTEQRDAERVMLDLLGTELGLTLGPARIQVPSGERVEVDGADLQHTVLVECWAHQGPPKSAQRHKVLADAFKLHWISTTLYPRPRRILCLSDPAAAAPFLPQARSWAARALQDLDITVMVVPLPDDVRDGILAAQRRQYR